MKYYLNPLRILFTVYCVIVFIILMFLALPFVIAASFFGPVQGGNFIYRVCHVWADGCFLFSGMYHRKITEQALNKKKQYIYIANHNSYIDIPQIMKAVRAPLRILGKYEMSKVPVFGYIYSRAVVMVDRSNPARRAKSVRKLKAVLRKGISIFIFPEGTFNMQPTALKEFYDGAFRIAIETQTPLKPLLFLDNYQRMHYSSLLSITPGRVRTVYLEEVSVEGLAMSDVAMLKDKVFRQMEDALKKYGAKWIGEEQDPARDE
jgi:1-acyl-sn-glycerol-3-phosphate acyltransferase